MKTLVFDIETDNLYDKVTVTHCAVTIDAETGAVKAYRPDDIPALLQDLAAADKLIGHNIMAYDIPVLHKLYGFEYTGELFDTLIMSRLIWSNVKDEDFAAYKAGRLQSKLIGRYSLEAWGARLGVHKGDYGKQLNAWETFSEEMLVYCIQDVKLTKELYDKILETNYSTEAMEMEHQIHAICLQQTKHGFPIDVEAATLLSAELSDEKLKIEKQLVQRFGGWWESDGLFTPKMTRGGYIAGSPLTKISWTDFNPSSREHISKKLIELGWKPSVFTETGQPKVDETTLTNCDFVEAEWIKRYLLVQKRLGQIADGKQAWLRLERDGLVHGEVVTMGAVTSRCTHQNPNMAQVPKVGTVYGTECRALFYAPAGYKLMGCDVSGLELRMLAHFMAAYDGGAYGKILLEGDIHSANQEAAGLPTRNSAKTFIYGFLYGAGDEKIGKIIGKGAQAGKHLKAQFLKKTPALAKLRKAVEHAATTRGFLKGLDGRRMHCRSAHSSLNTLLQGGGALVCKRWVITFHQLLKERGFVDGVDYKQVAFIHDEVQVLVKESHAETIGQICIEAIKQAGEHYNLRIALDGEFKVGANWAETH
jgi:DNA polymerase I